VTLRRAEDLERSAPSGPTRVEQASPGRDLFDLADRWATRVFIALIVAAVPIYLFLGRNRWFFRDEWDFLADRSLAWSDLMRPHNEHWSTIPILEYRLFWRLFGLHTYVPYQLVVIVLHLAAAVLLWLIARSSGARLWCATVAAAVFVYFGFGSQDILWAFQVTFDGALVFGLAQLYLSGHGGPVGRRDALGVVCGVVGLMFCSSIAVVMVGVVAVATWARRGWRIALFHSLPPAIVFSAWWLTEAGDAYRSPNSSLVRTAQFVGTGLRNTLRHLGGGVPVLGYAIAAFMAIGLVLAWSRRGVDLRRQAAAPAALLLGAVVFLAAAGYGRTATFGVDFAERSRYAHVTLALAVPALAIALDALVSRWRWLAPALLVSLVVGVPHNLAEARKAPGEEAQHRLVLAMAASPLLSRVPAKDLVDRANAPLLTAGFVRRAVRADKVPADSSLWTDDRIVGEIRLSLQQSTRPSSPRCETLSQPIEQHLGSGDVVDFRGGRLQVTKVVDGKPRGAVVYQVEYGARLTARLAIDVQLAPATRTAVQLCH
jgi:hypothetical protein